MATRLLVDRPFPDLVAPDMLDAASLDIPAPPADIVGPAGESEPAETRLGAARGILFALLLCAPFWMAVIWLLL